MHPEARNFLTYCKYVFSCYMASPEFKILDVGSGDINGNNRLYFHKDAAYVGCDVYPGKNVTVVSPCHKLTYSDKMFDVIISSECFEHDMHYRDSVAAIYRMLKDGGICCRC